MLRTMRLGLILVAAVIGLFAIHVRLNLGGWPGFLRRLRGGEERGELVVGFLPVT